MKLVSFLFLLCVVVFSCSPKTVIEHKLTSSDIRQYGRTDFDIDLAGSFANPHDQREVKLDMRLTTPSGKRLVLPCFFDDATEASVWRARFTPQESGTYRYRFAVTTTEKTSESEEYEFVSKPTQGKGFLHVNDLWTLRFDSGEPFRGIGENVGWESRSFEDDKWTYDYLLPSLSGNGANFFRTWMCVWNLPVTWKRVDHTKRYTSSNQYFNESGIRRMDELVKMSDSLGLYFMVSIDAHGALMPGAEWKNNNHNIDNGGPAATPYDFFANEESKAMYRNRLRYLVARWGYSPSIAAWEFFNEIDNAVFTPTPHDSVLIDHTVITKWHDEMSTYLKEIDPYGHIVTTSISHRDIEGMNDLENIDINQKHIYNKTHLIAPTILEYTRRHGKPYIIGEFGYDWNWDNVKHEAGAGFDHDYKRGLWYGMFSPTPVLPMTWWWEFFDERNMTPYFRSVREINDRMMKAGKGDFELIENAAGKFESYAVKCGDHYFVYVLNNTDTDRSETVKLNGANGLTFNVEVFNPANRRYADGGTSTFTNGVWKHEIELASHEERILILAPQSSSMGSR